MLKRAGFDLMNRRRRSSHGDPRAVFELQQAAQGRRHLGRTADSVPRLPNRAQGAALRDAGRNAARPCSFFKHIIDPGAERFTGIFD
ncbi:MAG TPA: hypothetical protein VKU82_09070 [Planctomycetaceae bacterium]|nr:hypothetical protein [Planctomycetaceae bacterium]